jgi:hypothetical protein
MAPQPQLLTLPECPSCYPLSLSLSSLRVACTSMSGDGSGGEYNEGVVSVGFLSIVGPILIVRFHPF